MMNEETILNQLVETKPNDQLDLFESIDRTKIAKSICAFLNHNGGTIVIGVTKNGHISGIKNHLVELKKLRAYLVLNIVPDTTFTISPEELNEKNILVLKFPKGINGPYIFKGDIYFRSGSETRKATSQELSEIIHSRKISEQRWERQFSLGVDINDIDLKLVKLVLNESKNRSSYLGKDPLDFLNHVGLYQNGRFTNAAVILFGTNPSRFLPQIRVRLTEYAADKTDSYLIRDELYEGNIFETRNKFEDYFNSLGIRAVFQNRQWKRVDFKFPPKALQEGIINALIHRDYSNPSSSLTVSVYPDKIIILNSGKLPIQIKVSDLRKTHKSHPTNPDIAHIVFLNGFIDKLGKGTMKMIKECRDFGLKDPKWKETNEGIQLTLLGPKSLSFRKPIQDSLNEELKTAVFDIFNEKIDVKSRTVLNRLISILSYIHVFPNTKAIELQEFFGVSERTILSDLKRLKPFLDYKGSKKFGWYEIKEVQKNSILSYLK